MIAVFLFLCILHSVCDKVCSENCPGENNITYTVFLAIRVT